MIHTTGLQLTLSSSDLALWVKSFGAQISLNVDKYTTHVVANPDRKTSKVKKAARILHEGGNMQIVTVDWVTACCTQWEHIEEEKYYIDVDDERDSPAAVEELEEEDDEEESIDGADDNNPQSPTSLLDMADGDWEAIAKEIEEFEGESDSEGSRASDTESVNSANSTQSETNGTKVQKHKRKRGIDSDAESEAGDSDSSTRSTSKLQKRKKRTMERVTSLTNVVNADKQPSGLPSPETTGPEEEQGDEFDPQGGGNDLAGDLDEDLEADMLAEFNAGFDDE